MVFALGCVSTVAQVYISQSTLVYSICRRANRLKRGNMPGSVLWNPASGRVQIWPSSIKFVRRSRGRGTCYFVELDLHATPGFCGLALGASREASLQTQSPYS